MKRKRVKKMHPRLGDEKCKLCRGYGTVFSNFTNRMERCACRNAKLEPRPQVKASLPYKDD